MAKLPEYFHFRVVQRLKEMKVELQDVSDHDFVEVVRCIDCINWNGNDCVTMYGLFAAKPNDYCARAQRSVDDG